MKNYISEAQAEQDMYKNIADCCIDNYRFAYLDDEKGMKKYNEAKELGCCGFYDDEVIIAGRKATIGCNYGH
jgi:hypothetical protein